MMINEKMRSFLKRFFDIVVGFIGLVITGPVILMAALLVFAQDRQAPFYLAERLGRVGHPFRMVKLRSMHVGADRAGIDVVGARDPRVTRLGWFLRDYKIDELPQFWNIIIGDMSLVGPRPDTPAHIAVLSPEEREVLNAKPGLTDLASIVYSRLAELFSDSDDLEADYILRMRPLKAALGIWYVRNWTPFMDILICALTPLALVHYNLAIKGVGLLLAYYGAPEPLRHAVAGVMHGEWRMKSLSEYGLTGDSDIAAQPVPETMSYRSTSMSR